MEASTSALLLGRRIPGPLIWRPTPPALAGAGFEPDPREVDPIKRGPQPGRSGALPPWLYAEIECPKHQGAFDYRMGETLRLPPCVNLRSYPVTVESGRVSIDIG
jgi:hypothetical protein